MPNCKPTESPDDLVGAHTLKNREETYGPPEETHARTASLWQAYIDNMKGKLTGIDVCLLNILQKVARAQHGVYHEDNLIDIGGYAKNADIVWRKINEKTT